MKNINNSKLKSSRDHDLIAELSKMKEHNYEDFLEEVSLDLSIYLLGYVLDEENLECWIFMEQSVIDQNFNLVEDFINIFQCLDNDAPWKIKIVEIDNEDNHICIDVINWYMGSIIEGTNLNEDEKKKLLTELRSNFSTKLN